MLTFRTIQCKGKGLYEKFLASKVDLTNDSLDNGTVAILTVALMIIGFQEMIYENPSDAKFFQEYSCSLPFTRFNTFSMKCTIQNTGISIRIQSF